MNTITSEKVPQAQSSVADLPVPIVEGATSNNMLDPFLARDGVKVTVEFPGMSDRHKIHLRWDGPLGAGNPTIPVKDGSNSGSIEFEIGVSVIAACMGYTVGIWYTAILDDQPSEESITLDLTVQKLKPQVSPAPELPDVVTYQGTRWLDMRKFSGDARIQLQPWPLMVEGQRLWILAVGNEHHAGNYRFEWVLENHRVTALEVRRGFTQLLLSRDWLEGNDDYSSITVQAAFTSDGSMGTPPADPTVSLLPANALELRFTTENLRLGEPELDLKAPNVLEATECGAEGCLLNPINAKHGATIRVVYAGMAPTDWVCAFFEGAAGAGTPPLECVYGSNKGFVEVPVPPSAISANFGRSVTVRYTVLRDQIQWPSLPLNLKVLGLTDLPMPEVTQATLGELDLRTFSGNAECTVAPWWFIAEGQPTWLWVTGELEDGTPYRFDVLMGQGLPASGEDDGVISWLPRHELEKLADCSKLQVHFAVNFNGQVDHPSSVRFPLRELTVHQQDLNLIPPTVDEAARDFLNPVNATDGVTVRVMYDRISPRHTIQLRWERPDGTTLPIQAKPGNDVPGYVEFKVSLEEVIACIGQTVSLGYTVTSPCKQATSLDLNLKVLVPKHWSKLVVLEATLGILDLSNFDGDATIKVKPWAPWMVVGQRVWIRGEGTGKDGSPYEFDVMVGEPVSATEVDSGLQRVLLRSELESLKRLSKLVLTCRLTPDGDTDVSKAIELQPLELIVRSAYEDLTDFKDYYWNGWQKGPAAQDERDLVVRSDGTGWFLFNWGYTSPNNGIHLHKTYRDLEPNRLYAFNVELRRNSTANPIPQLSLEADGLTVAGPMTLSSRTWVMLGGEFIATSSEMELTLVSHVNSVPGNDYDVTRIQLKEI
ncbi:hypothetical protein [Pseudomonas sp. BIC9C]|uniref:hypothetical protein n=1 Tax=Pseudomonas sp. BIC9C TaxID=3078458 RepID=UPI002AD27575|nr:hypothetical protein [Pseudomonas sp. BIC9C]